MQERSSTHVAAAFVVAWMALVGVAAVFCAWGLHELRQEHSYQVEYVDVKGRTHRIRASSPEDLERMLRAMEARFPR